MSLIVNTFKVNWLKTSLNIKIQSGISSQIIFLIKLVVYLFSWHVTFCQTDCQQALLAWKLCFVHNFSPHKILLWNNSDIRKKSLSFPKWFQRDIRQVHTLIDDFGNMLSYEQFIPVHNFPVPFREFKAVTHAVPNGLIQLVKNHLILWEDYYCAAFVDAGWNWAHR